MIYAKMHAPSPKERIVSAILLSLVLTGLVLIIKPAGIARMDTERVRSRRFWVRKVFPGKKFNMLILGDSRVYRGLSPGDMQSGLPGLSIHNFGFAAGGLNSEMYIAAEKLLDKQNMPNLVLLGITPLALTAGRKEYRILSKIGEASGNENEQFNLESKKPWEEIFQSLYIDPFIKRLQPFSPAALIRVASGAPERPENEYGENEYHDNGWMASNESPRDFGPTLKIYRDIYSTSGVSPALVEELLAWTREWNNKGISVFAFMMPCSKEMEELEKEMCGLNRKALKERFKDAGGIWLEVDSTLYYCYDGTHLTKESAARLSRDISKQIALYLK